MGKNRFSGEPGNELILIGSRPRFQRIFRARVQKNMGKTYIRKDCPSVYALMTLFILIQLANLYHPFRKRNFFLRFFFFCIGNCVPLLQGYSLEKSSTMILQSIWTFHGL